MVSFDDSLIPASVQAEVIQAVVEESVVLKLAQTQPMPTAAETVPVLGSFPTAGWIGSGERKPVTQMNWTAAHLKAEEIAATIDVPTAYIDDAGFPLWESIQPRMVEALSLALDEAVLFGTGAPPSFPVGGVFAASTPVALPAAPENDIAGLFNAALATVEAQGLDPTGHAADVVTRSLLRGARTTTGEPLYIPSIVGNMPDTVYGLPIGWSRGGAFDTTKAIDLTGDWTCLRIGIRQDIQVDQSAEAVLADAAGKVLVSAFQDDKIIMRIHARFGCVIGKPVTHKAPTGANPWAHIPPGLVTSAAASNPNVNKETDAHGEPLQRSRTVEEAEGGKGRNGDPRNEESGVQVDDTLTGQPKRNGEPKQRNGGN